MKSSRTLKRIVYGIDIASIDKCGFLIDNSYLHISEIDLSPLRGFNEWKEALCMSLVTHAIRCRMPEAVLSYLKKEISICHKLYCLDGMGDIFIFKWPSGEIKIFPLWGGNRVIEQNLHWIEYYPFIKVHQRREGFRLMEMDLADTCMSSIHSTDERVNLISTLNDHFGHFIVDCLPYLQLLEGPMAKGSIGANSILCSPIGYSQGIEELLAIFRISNGLSDQQSLSNKLPSSQNGDILIGSGQKMVQFISSSVLTAGYFQERTRRILCQRLKIDTCNSELNNKSRCRIALLRCGRYNTRVQNIEELRKLLLRLGFTIFDPSVMGLRELMYTLNKASLVVSEGGSTTVNAAHFSSVTTRIISLNPMRLFENPTREMLIGGLPYILTCCNKVEYFLGETTIIDSIQSSDTVYYNLEELTRVLQI